MKRAFFILIIVCIAVLTWIVYQFMSINLQGTSVDMVEPIPSTIEVKPDPTITVGDTPYTYAFVRVATASAITLIPNFSEKRVARSLADDNKCAGAINGGFYDITNKPLGFFYTDSRTYGPKISSTLVNGFFWADTNGTALISSDLPRSSYRFAIQTGPLLLFNGQTIPLSIREDTPARRMVVAKTTDSQVVFITVYSADSVYSGPLLGKLPSVIDSIRAKEKLDIADAINLDGGSASAFYTADTRLSELTPVGSIFCIK